MSTSLVNSILPTIRIQELQIPSPHTTTCKDWKEGHAFFIFSFKKGAEIFSETSLPLKTSSVIFLARIMSHAHS